MIPTSDYLLYSSVREKFNFHPQNITDLASLLTNKTLDPTKFTAKARAIHSILSVNKQYTTYYKSPDSWKEHTKPLFNTHEIMNVHILYFYHCINDIFKVLKYRTPISLYSLFETSDRLGKETFILTPKPSDSYIYKAGTIWNTVRQNLMLTTFTCKTNHLKSSIKTTIAHIQKEGEPNNWNSVRQNSKNFKVDLA